MSQMEDKENLILNSFKKIQQLKFEISNITDEISNECFEANVNLANEYLNIANLLMSKDYDQSDNLPSSLLILSLSTSQHANNIKILLEKANGKSFNKPIKHKLANTLEKDKNFRLTFPIKDNAQLSDKNLVIMHIYNNLYTFI